MKFVLHLFLPTLLALAACSPSATDAQSNAPGATKTAPQVHATSGLQVIPVTISSKSATHVIRAELAASRVEQSKGLMFRTEMGADEGMLFPMKPSRRASFWMKNTVIPLDIIFIGEDRRILNIAANTVPYSEEQVLADGLTIAVLELAGGRAAELGISAGDTVEW